MKAMILAAGLGTRLRPITNTIPKPLLPVAGTPLIVWNLLLLRQAGITEVIINLHHLGDLIEKELGDGSRFGLRLIYSREAVLLGTGGGMKHAAWFFGDGPFLVMNGDTLLDLDLGGLIREHAQGATTRGALATLVVRPDPDVERWGAVELVGRRIVRITGRGVASMQTSEPIDKRMFAGVHIIHPRVLSRLPTGQPSSIIDAYVEALAEGQLLCGYPFEGYWSDVGSPERYAQVQQDAERGLINLASRSGK
jgi:NDP-sugar pyrophosphorylase family protein